MPVALLDHQLKFPAVGQADKDGLLAIGGDLSPERLLLAYKHGIFPWYDEAPVLWWSPDPRFVLFPEKFKISKTVKSLINKTAFSFTINTAFPEVIHHCKHIPRAGQSGTWITPEVQKAYIRMHELGHAHSAEVWQDGKLAGGLYGIRLGKVFFGESMFCLVSNASRYCFTQYVQQLIQEGIKLIDCQVYTSFLESMGAEMIPRRGFVQLLEELI